MKTELRIAAIGGFLAVAFGAFGAHLLRGKVEPNMLAVWQTAVQYHLFHMLALLAVAIAGTLLGRPLPLLKKSCWVMIIGVVIFSGSLYALVLTNISQLGMITPVGGTLLMVSWLMLCFCLPQLGGDKE